MSYNRTHLLYKHFNVYVFVNIAIKINIIVMPIEVRYASYILNSKSIVFVKYLKN